MRCAVPPTQPPAAVRPVVRSDLSAGRGAGVLREVPAASEPPAAKLHSRTWEMFFLAEAARGQDLGLSPKEQGLGDPWLPERVLGRGPIGNTCWVLNPIKAASGSGSTSCGISSKLCCHAETPFSYL